MHHRTAVSSSSATSSSPSPVFDIPEFPTLRRIKPLPKRRRVTVEPDLNIPHGTQAADSVGEAVDIDSLVSLPQQLQDEQGVVESIMQHSLDLQLPLLPRPDATPEELLAHAEQLSAQMALQSYYMPILGGVKELLKSSIQASLDAEADGDDNPLSKQARLDALAAGIEDLSNSIAAHQQQHVGKRTPMTSGLSMSMQQQNLDGAESDGERDRNRDFDEHYTDHLRQPGNTKKRKVPTNATSSPNLYYHHRGEEDAVGTVGRGNFGGEDDVDDPGDVKGPGGAEGGMDGGNGRILSSSTAENRPESNSVIYRRGKLSPATLAGLQHKEMLKMKKRQLAAVLGALSHGDTLALDQALSASYPPFNAGSVYPADVQRIHQQPKIKLSHRKGPKVARAIKRATLPRHPDSAPFPRCDFSFSSISATSERLITTKEEVATLRKRFEAELARQAAKAAKLAAADRLAASASSRRSKRSARAKQRARTSGGKVSDDSNKTAEFLDPSGGVGTMIGNSLSGGMPTKPRPGKKKKRSALANASNPHHLRNYVPSRLPHSSPFGNVNHLSNALNELGPFPIRFLSAEIPPRRSRGKKSPHPPIQPSTQLTNPADEWICALCEYELFYGDDQDFRRALRNRKKILRRRRRARERAAAAASGRSAPRTNGDQDEDEESDVDEDEEYDDGYDEAPAQFAPMPSNNHPPGIGNLGRDQVGDFDSFG